MGLFGKELANIVEWNENRDDVLFWKWKNSEIKKGSRLIIRPGQDAIFLYNGKVENVGKDEGNFSIDSEIIPFLDSLKGFKYGFDSGLRAEVIFINTKEFTEKWGTKSEINIPAEGLNLPGGIPVRAFGTFSFKIQDYQRMIEKLAGIRGEYTTADVKERVMAKLDQFLMKWIVKEGKNITNLMVNAEMISAGICSDLNVEMEKIGIEITDFSFQNINYPEEIQKMIKKAASQSMVGDLDRYQRMAIADGMANGRGAGGSAADMASAMVGAQMGMAMGSQITQSLQGNMGVKGQPGAASGNRPNFCPNCGTKTGNGNFCSNCGMKLV